MPYIGNQPFGKTVRTVTTETITSVKTDYYPNGGYMAGYVDVYVNGVRLSESLDFTATDGSLVTLLYSPSIGDTVEIVTFGSVEIANAVRRSGDTFSGNVYVGSNVYISTSTISVGNATVNTQITAGNLALNGSTLTIGNSTVNTVFTGDTVTVGGTLSLGNTAITGTANVTTAINVGANVSMNTTSIRVGNSTVNTYIVSDTIYGPSTLYIDPAAAGDNTGLVIVKGDLQVDGTTFTINSANVTVNDKNVVLASGAINNAATDGAGLTIYGTNANLTYNATGNNFEMSRGLSITGTANVSVGLNVGANVNLSTSQINVGNSTVNTVISSASFTTTSNTFSIGTAISVAANGNVGVGTSPGASYRFDVSGGLGLVVRGGTDGSVAIRGASGYSNFISFNESSVADRAAIGFANGSGNLQFRMGGYNMSSGTQSMTLDSSGNLLVGTTTASANFYVYNAPVSYAGLNTTAIFSSSASQSTGTGGLIAFEGKYTSGGSLANFAAIGGLKENSTDSNYSGYLGFYTRLNGSLPAERMRIDSSGNLGVGTSSPSAEGKLTVGSTTVTDKNGIILSRGAAGTPSNLQGGIFYEYNGLSTSETLTFRTNGGYKFQNANGSTTYTTIDLSGRLLVGLTSSIAINGIAQIGGHADTRLIIDGSSTQGIYFTKSGADNGTFRVTSGGNYEWYVKGAATANMVLDTSGNLLVGVTSGSYHTLAKDIAGNFATEIRNSNANPYGLYIRYSGTAPNGSVNEFLYCGDTVGQKMSIRSNGGIANYSGSNANLSDRREKTNFAPAKSYLNVICAIPVQTFNYIDQDMKDDGGLTLGVVAQDVQAVAPELVMESNWANKNEEPKMRLSIYQTDLQFALMKCIQEQQILITQLTARITALES